jgi:small subunit ribosomal protein S6
MNNYELMVIFTPVLSEEEFKSVQKKYTDHITDSGGSITHSNPWGLKSLAYPVQRKPQVFTGFLSIQAPSDLNEGLKISS